MTREVRPIDVTLIVDIAAAWDLNLTDAQQIELLEFLRRDIPVVWKRARPAARPDRSNRAAPPKDNLRRFLVEFGLHFERAGGQVSGSWARDPSRGITGKYAAGMRVVWAALPLPRPPVERFVRHVRAYPNGWKSRGCSARADYLLQQYNAWRK